MDRRPALPVAVDFDTARVRVDSRFGTKYAEYEMAYTEYDVGRIREGYCCLECGEAQERPFPEKCVCGFPMRELQSAKFAEQFDGYTTVGPSKNLAELRAEDEEAKERVQRGRAKPTSSIVVPSWVKP